MDLNQRDLSQYDVTLDIQELVLIDVPVQDQQELKQSVTVELTRLFQAQGIPGALGEATRRANVDAGQLSVSGGQALGVEIAQAIYRGLGG